MSKQFRPMLAASPSREEIAAHLKIGPLWVSFKIDGIRGLVRNGQLVSRSLKPIPNVHTQQAFGQSGLEGLDGELICGDLNAPNVFSETTSAVMSEGGHPSITYWVFDRWDLDAPWHYRYTTLSDLAKQNPLVQILPHTKVETLEQLEDIEANAYDHGYEGLILRRYTNGRYKTGRSTVREGLLMKLKGLEDSEAIVIGFEELMRNQNEAQIDNLGLQKRSSHKANKVPGNTLGKLHVRDIKHGWEFSIGTGFTQSERDAIWTDQPKFMDKIVSYRFMRYGMKDVPRQPSFKGFRSPLDL